MVISFTGALVILALLLFQTPSLPVNHPRLDDSTKKLPSLYMGHNPQAIIEALQKLQISKDTFESSKEYAKRIEVMRSSPVTDVLTLRDTVALLIDDLPNYNATMQQLGLSILYNADTQNITVKCSTRASFRLFSKKQELGHYIGSNAYGAQREIAKLQVDDIAVKFVEDEKRRYGRPPGDFTFPLSAAKARELISTQQLRALLIGTLAAPFYTKSQYYSRAKMTESKPTDYYQFTENIHLQLKEIWFLQFPNRGSCP